MGENQSVLVSLWKIAARLLRRVKYERVSAVNGFGDQPERRPH